MKILVVHRQEEVVEIIKSALPSNQLFIRYCNSGLDGLLAARVESFDLIICSTDLPVVTGFEVIRNVRTNSVNKKVPVFFLVEESELTEKINQLAKSLTVAGILYWKDLSTQIAPMIKDQVVVHPDILWEDILARTA
jgi:DNA-binding response OmpR family regulator